MKIEKYHLTDGTYPMFFKRNTPVALLLCVTLMTLFSCGKKENGEALKELNISYVKAPFNLQVMVMKKKRMLEKEFAPDGIQVNWHEITSGAKQAEAMAAGSLDIASVINTASVIIANSAGNGIDIVDMVSRPVDTFAIMVREDGPKTVKDLSGKTVAGPKGTVLHQLLVAVEEKEGLKDVSFVSMGLPQSQTALLSGKVDAALLAASLVLKTKAAGGRVLTTSAGYVTPLLVTAVPRDFAGNHKGIVERYKKVQNEAYYYILSNPDEVLKIGAAEQGISEADALELYARSGMADSVTKDDMATLEKDVAFLINSGMIESVVDPEDMTSSFLMYSKSCR